MIEKFSDIDKVATMIALLAGLWGTILNFSRRHTDNFSMKKKILMFFMDMFVNIGITMLIYLGFIGYGINELLAVAVSGFAGHQGVRSFYLMELIITEKIGAKDTFDQIKEDRNGTV